jgi:hypothetical protein
MPKIPIWVYFGGWKMFGIVNGQWVQVGVIWYIFPVLVCLDQEKSGFLARHCGTKVIPFSVKYVLPINDLKPHRSYHINNARILQ